MTHPPAPTARRQGVAQYENGGVYIGEFAGDVRCGWGTHYFPGKDKYEGEWAADRMHGAPGAGRGRGRGYVGGWPVGSMHGGWRVGGEHSGV